MIDTAMTVLAKGAVEHAKDTVDNVAERMKDADLPQLTRQVRERGGGMRWMLFAFGALGVATIVMIVMRRRRVEPDSVTPDVFGEAVAEERAAGMLGRNPIATPGA